METQLVGGGPLKEFKREELLQRLSGSWKGRSIFALLEVPRFQKNPREIAPELGITLDELFFYLDLQLKDCKCSLEEVNNCQSLAVRIDVAKKAAVRHLEI